MADRGLKILVALLAAYYLFIGAALLLGPQWFFESIGPFPPFNRHYMGDLGAYHVALAVGLALAARDPRHHALLIGTVGLGGLLHVGNHLYDDWLAGAWSLSHALTETLPLAVLAALPLWMWKQLRSS